MAKVRVPDPILEEWERQEAAGERIVFRRVRDDEYDEYDEAYEAWREEQAEEERREEEAYVDSLDPWEQDEYWRGKAKQEAKRAAAERAGRGAGGMSPRSRAKMWRDVLSLPFELLGERPLWITLTYPDDWGRWVPDGRVLERHRQAFGKRWERAFDEGPMGAWSKEFQLKNGRPHLHLFLKGPASMSDEDYGSLQALTRLAKRNERTWGEYQGRRWTPIIGERKPGQLAYGGGMATDMRRWWSEIVTGGTEPKHEKRGVAVRTVFYAHDDAVARDMRRARLAAYMAGELAKSGQKVPPDGFGTVGNYFGYWGRAQGFKPVVEGFALEVDVGMQLVRRMALWEEMRRRAKGRPVGAEWKRRRSWQGLTVAGVTDEEYARLLTRATEAAMRGGQRAQTEQSA